MIEFNPIELVTFAIASFLVISGALLVIVAVCKCISDYMDGNTPMVRLNIKSELDSALGKKDEA